MTKDNASGAGMETVAWRYVDARGHFRYRGYRPNFDVEYAILKPIALVSRTDATRLLAESQAHNAKLEAQVERMREAIDSFPEEPNPFNYRATRLMARRVADLKP